MTKPKHGEVVAQALTEEAGQNAAPKPDAFTLSEEELALVNLFDDTAIDESTPSPTSNHEAEGVIPEEEEEEIPAPPSIEEESEAAKPPAEPSTPDETPEEPAPVALDLTSETQPPPKAEKPEEDKDLQAKRAKWREESIGKLEQYYASQLTDEDKDLLLTEPESVLPRLLARSHMDMYDSLMAGMGQQLPGQMTHLMETQRAAQSAEKAFFDKWPKLREAAKDTGKADVVRRTVQAYRQMNPTAAMEQAIAEAGAMAMVALKIPLSEVAASPPQKDKPFTPAAPGAGASTTPSAPRELNEFEKLAEELLTDEDM